MGKEYHRLSKDYFSQYCLGQNVDTVRSFSTGDLADDITANNDEIKKVMVVHLVKSLFLSFGAKSVINIIYRSSAA